MVTLSSAEAEYVALADMICEVKYLHMWHSRRLASEWISGGCIENDVGNVFTGGGF